MQSCARSAPSWRDTTAAMSQRSSTCWCAGMVTRTLLKHTCNGKWRSVACRGFLSTAFGFVALPAPLLASRTLQPRSPMTFSCRSVRHAAVRYLHRLCSGLVQLGELNWTLVLPFMWSRGGPNLLVAFYQCANCTVQTFIQDINICQCDNWYTTSDGWLARLVQCRVVSQCHLLAVSNLAVPLFKSCVYGLCQADFHAT